MEETKNVKIEDDNIITCPLCNEINLKHMRVDVGFRKEEDKSGIVTTITRENTMCSYQDDRHVAFSARRDRITIHFFCEACGTNSDWSERWMKMHINQHKGVTYITWATD